MKPRAAAVILVSIVLLLALAILLTPVEAQQAGKVHRIGFLSSLSRGDPPETLAFPDGLRELGYVEGENIAIEWRGGGGQASRFPAMAVELVGLNVDVIVATVNPAIEAARAATKTIPIVMVTPSDPVGLGFVHSLARPGGHVTGLTWQTQEAVPKRLQLLKEAVPGLSRVAVLWDTTEPVRRRQVKEAEDAASKLGLQLQVLAVRSPSDLEGAFAAMVRERTGAVLVEASTMLADQRAYVADLAAKSRLPTMGWYGRMVDAGYLMSYSPSLREQYRRAAYFVDQILKGAKPADLPIEQPTKFELVINLKTAKALGLTIPPSLLLRADQVIE